LISKPGRKNDMRPLMLPMLISAALLAAPCYAQNYQSVRIVAPEPEATIHDNNGRLTIAIAISPPLRREAGDRLTLLLDDKAVAEGQKLKFRLKNIDRGSHSLQVQVNAADGTVLATSPPVTFHMWRASRLFRNRQN
jgi:hypothetical protein